MSRNSQSSSWYSMLFKFAAILQPFLRNLHVLGRFDRTLSIARVRSFCWKFASGLVFLQVEHTILPPGDIKSGISRGTILQIEQATSSATSSKIFFSVSNFIFLGFGCPAIVLKLLKKISEVRTDNNFKKKRLGVGGWRSDLICWEQSWEGKNEKLELEKFRVEQGLSGWAMGWATDHLWVEQSLAQGHDLAPAKNTHLWCWPRFFMNFWRTFIKQ